MIRPFLRLARGAWLGLVATFAVAAPASAEPSIAPLSASNPAPSAPPRRLAIDTPRSMYVTPDAVVSPIVFLNRCPGGCVVHLGNNDARTDTSSIPMVSPSAPGPTDFHIGEFASTGQQIGSGADTEWAMLVKCMQEVYSPYQVTVTDVRPTSGQSYHEAIVAGQPGDIGLSTDILGVAPLASDCSAIDNVVSFSFANAHTQADAVVRTYNICWTAAQESAHAYGLDHEYVFADGNSACNDPMTYRTDCGGEKFYRNEAATCGEFAPRACKCGPTQNSHLKMLGVHGAGTPITAPPTVTLARPAAGDTMLGTSVAAAAGAQRGIAHVDFYFNGYAWATQPGTGFGTNGQPDPFTYQAVVPAALPNSIVDVKAIAYDDLGTATESAVVTVTKGAACANASTCATGQKCEAGKCFWDPASGEIGDTCTYPQFCKSGLCTGTAEQQICTQDCIPGVADSCPSGLSCAAQTANAGVCFFASSTGGGCCSVDGGSNAWWAHAGIAALVLGLIARRRRPHLRS